MSEKALQDEAPRRREPRRAALPTANDAQSARSVGSEQQPPTSHSLVMHAAPRARHLHEARTKTEALLRPPTTSMPRSCRTDRGGHWAESDVEDSKAKGVLGPTRLTMPTRVIAKGRGRLPGPSGPRSL